MRNICVSGTWKSGIINRSAIAQNQHFFSFLTELIEVLLMFSGRHSLSTDNYNNTTEEEEEGEF